MGGGEKSSPQESKGSVSFSANTANMCIPSQFFLKLTNRGI